MNKEKKAIMKELNGKNILITLSGQDHPGITSELFKIISQSQITTILDVGQSVTHGFLTLSMVIRIEESSEPSSHVIKDLLFASFQMGMKLDFKILDKKIEDSYQADDKFILNCVSQSRIPASFIHEITSVLAKNNVNIRRIDKVSPGAFKCLELTTSIPESFDEKQVKKDLLTISNHNQVDMAFLKDNVFRRSKRLIVFDMDSTLIQTEVIDELAAAHGVGDKIKVITESAMNGEIDFSESLIRRVSMLKGLKASRMHEILDNLQLTPGALEFIKTVQSLGYKLGIISGGFTFFANALKDQLNLNYAFANELEIIDGELTGKVLGTIIDANQKATLLKLIAQQENLSQEQVVAIGDGANDLPMLSTAGLGIAYHAKDIVRKTADHHMSHGPMTSILYFLGIPIEAKITK